MEVLFELKPHCPLANFIEILKTNDKIKKKFLYVYGTHILIGIILFFTVIV